ncbi:TAXI family TRAP transporter solute-binding subunit [Nocardiopsis sp. L17-MgMaSL7]|uniref:TAXI family TRAP transporter solute-binding subunit n=1 Tax=Nocardiopsis sp. L17-MgMaSL7 TaxID=1938893 RepID=UPI000D70AD2A|nr:TAXI family TRAP transporter solute-binding subunit [Nocardiopsis sp. L17-MgMaSL7]PWV58147.1 TRAP transporter TAXI family solute receptor [Nocardiopsis sp. L17-MgMaSL7]
MDTSPNVPDPRLQRGHGPQEPQSHGADPNPLAAHRPTPDAEGRVGTPLIVGATVLALALFGGALYWALPGLIGPPEPEHTAGDEPTVPYAGDYLLGEPTWGLGNSRLSREICEVWTDAIDEVTFSEQVAHDLMDPGVEFRALEKEVEAPGNGAAYRNDVVLTHNTWYTQLRDGTLDVRDGDPVGEPRDILVLGNVSAWTLQYVVRADSGIRSLDDLAGTTAVFSGDDPEVLELSDLTLLSAGLDPFSMEVVSGYDFDTDTPQQPFIDGDVDVHVLWGRVGNAELDHLERQGMDLRVLDVPEEVVATVSRVDPAYTNLSVQAGSLPGQEGDTNLLASWETLYAHADLDEDLVQELVRAVYEELGDHAPNEQIATVDQALSGVDPDSVHPGAARYLSERGVL